MPSSQTGWPDNTGSGEDTGVIVNAESGGGARTLLLSDVNTILELEGASAWTVTIPTNAATAIPVGSIVNITQIGSGAVTVTGDTGVTLNGVSAGGADIGAQWTGVSLYKRATDEWIMQGSLAAAVA
jgi:hypothetical protein